MAPLTLWECKRRIDLFMLAAGKVYVARPDLGVGYLGGAREWHHRFYEALREQEASEGLIAWRQQSDEARAWYLEHPTFDPEQSEERGAEACRRLGLDS